MEKIKYLLTYCLISFFLGTTANAQVSPYCPNLGFEQGNFQNWVGYNWIYGSRFPARNSPPELVSLPSPRRQEIMTNQNAWDPNTGNKLRIIPPGYRYSVRLGDIYHHDSIGADTSRLWNQSLRYTMTIDSSNALLIIKFAVVLENPDHAEIEEPRFKLTLFDQIGNKIPDCANYDVYASNANVRGFQTFNTLEWRQGSWMPLKIQWRDWTTVGVNLLKYVGQTITIEFMTADCTLGGHGGHSYFVAECHPLYITVKYCTGDTIASLKAPEGFEKYRWTNGSGTLVDTMQILNVDKTKDGETYTCTMTSATGCSVELQSTIARYEIKKDFTSTMIDCRSNIVQINNLSTTSRGKLDYSWDFDDGKIWTEREPRYTFATSGRHIVSLILSNPPSTCADTLTKEIESFSPPLVGIAGDSTYCPGLATWQKAYGAWDYTWSNGSKADSIGIRAPGGKYWLLGRSSTGCVSDTIYKSVSEEPDWEFTDQSDTTLCIGGEAPLSVTGAVGYLWSTNDTTNSIIVRAPGNYTVKGSNARGCKKFVSLNVKAYPLPFTAFNTSPAELNSKHNRLTCSLTAHPGISYAWDMGDGATETGPVVRHTYNISDELTAYTVTLTATSQFGCTDSASAIVNTAPFIPNVFSPNGDGINDLFMPDMDLQVIDRYGLELYKGSEGWDGTYIGRRMDPDTYYYRVRYTDKDQREQTRKGFITLVR